MIWKSITKRFAVYTFSVYCDTHTDWCFSIFKQLWFLQEKQYRKIVSLHCHTLLFFDGVKIHVLKRVCFMQNAENQWNIIQSGGLVFMWKLSPPISPPVRCGILLQFAVWIKRKTADNDWLSAVFIVLLFVWVIRLGFEPKTPTLKVLCSTCWASESILYCC